MSDETPKDPHPESNAAPAEAAAAPKKKRGFWGWLTGSSEEAPSPEGPASAEAEPEAPAEEATAAPATVTEEAAASAASAPEPAPEAPVETPEEEASQPVVAEVSVPAEPSPAPVEEEAAVPVAGEPPVMEAPTPAETTAPEEPEAAPVPSEAVAPLSAGESQEAALPVSAEEEPAKEQPVAEIRIEETSPAEAAIAEELAAGEASSEPPAETVPAPEGTEASARKGFWSRLASGLSRTASSLTQGITSLVTKRKLDDDTLEDLEDLLIRADLGTDTSMRIVSAVAKGRYDQMIAPEEVKSLIAAEVEKILEPVAAPLVVDASKKPFVVLMVGVNGSGKTTTIGKLAAQWRDEGKKVVMAAGDTFRAAAIEQLKVWGTRTGAKVIAREQGSDAAGVAHEAVVAAREDGADILLIDTAGRLQNRTELMAELEKVVRVVKKLEPQAPHAVLLVLDATVGQNALSQVEAFTRVAGVTGLVMTKLDGTARGGILVAIADKYHLPVHLIGVGEGAEDLQPFTARDFARAIVGLD